MNSPYPNIQLIPLLKQVSWDTNSVDLDQDLSKEHRSEANVADFQNNIQVLQEWSWLKCLDLQ